jgi:hypothetical protein
MKRIASIALLALLSVFLALPAAAQQGSVTAGPSFSAGVWWSPAFNYKDTLAANSTTGTAGTSYSITLYNPFEVTADGRMYWPWSGTAAFVVGSLGSSNQETVTSYTASSGCSYGQTAHNGCTISATYTYAHGPGDYIASNTSGYGEALLDASNHNGGIVYWVTDSGVVTLSTIGTTTTMCTNCLPALGIVMGVVARVETTITSACTGWELGDGTTAARFTANNTGLTAGTVSGANVDWYFGAATPAAGTGPWNTSQKSLVLTCAGGDAGAGAVRAKVFGYTLATPNF